MNFELSEEQLVLRKSVRELCERLIIPNARRWDQEEIFPHEIIPAMGEMGLLGMQIPEEYGGAGMKFLDYVVALEEVARADASVGLTMASHNSLCTGHLYLAGSEAQRKKYLPRLATGQALGGWGLTEPGSGSDAGAARTRAVRRGTGWVINGTKTFITQGSVGSIYVVLASTSPEKKAKGLTAFIVERGTPGFRTGKRIEKMGLHASDTTELVFEEVEVSDDQRLGEIDGGFFDTLRILDKGRIGIGAWSVGIGRAALEASLKYAKERVQFDKPIGDFQAIQHMLADMATELDAARLLVWRAALMQDHKQKTTQESATAKYYAARATMRACNAAVQIHGGYGYTREFDVERYMRDAKLAEIGEGTNEVQKMVIARELLKGSRGVSAAVAAEAAARAAAVRAGDVRAAARLMRDLDDRRPGAREALAALYGQTGAAFVVGITGAPGVGKSTLVDALVTVYRATGARVGVVAVDPSSPFSGGALLGDRVRMQRHFTDEGVFIRSLATRGQLGGLSRSTTAAVAVLDAAGFPMIFVETVGVGQAEIDVARMADAVVVVTAPGLGDGVQALKAGLLEIADVLVVNKGDREGADLALRDLTTMLQIAERPAWPGEAPRAAPTLVRTVASTGEGTAELVRALEALRALPAAEQARRRRRQAAAQVVAIVSEITQDAATEAIGSDEDRGPLAPTIDAVAARTLDPWSAAETLTAAARSARR